MGIRMIYTCTPLFDLWHYVRYSFQLLFLFTFFSAAYSLFGLKEVIGISQIRIHRIFFGMKAIWIIGSGRQFFWNTFICPPFHKNHSFYFIFLLRGLVHLCISLYSLINPQKVLVCVRVCVCTIQRKLLQNLGVWNPLGTCHLKSMFFPTSTFFNFMQSKELIFLAQWWYSDYMMR